ncbi:hypothetical protein [Azospirillum sp.]|uniref:hypothetical protein n=1 Tax=Azospirillum sp. TaxID=34012 RepID=UPI003D73DEF6
MTAPILMAAVALALAGCAGAGPPGSTGSTGPAPAAVPSSGSSDAVAWPRLTQGQRLALRQGCRALHGRDFEKYNACVAGENRSQQALERGCAQRYAGNAEMIRNCQGM